MARADFRPWLHWSASFVLLVLYLPSYLALPFTALKLVERMSSLDAWELASSTLVSCAVVSGCLPWLVLGGRRLEPRTRTALWGFLIVYCLPHSLLVGVWLLSFSRD